jgi:phosphopantothenoylcysteine decarboxylase
MNTQMYTHPITAHHLSLIKTHLPYIEIVNPIEKILACGDVGMGGMAEWGDVVGRVVRKLNLRIRQGSEEDDEEEDGVVGQLEDETNVEEGVKDEDEDDEGEEEDEGIRAGGEEHEDEKRDNEVREREEEEEERQHLSKLPSRANVTKSS